MSRSLREQQWNLLNPLLQEALERNPFQRARLASLPHFPASLEDFTTSVPLTLKSELAADQALFPPFGQNTTYPLSTYTRFCQTSGTTALPLSVLDTPESWDWILDNWQRGYALAEVQPGMSAYFAFSFGPFLGFWSAFEAGTRMGLRCFPGGGLSSRARLQALLRLEAEVLCCTPTYALHLAHIAQQEGIRLHPSPLRRILVAGEPGGSLPAVRAQLALSWPQAEVLDHYGMTEVGPVAFAPRHQPDCLRVLEERYLAEILDPITLQPTPEGALGELILTPLGRSSWPLFRYRTGDLVRARRSPQGHLELLGGILGRSDDMVVVRGVNLYPGAVEDVVRSLPDIEEYRVTVDASGTLAEVVVEIESSRSAAREKALENALEEALEKAFSLRIPVRSVSTGSLPRFELKARRWLVHRRAAPTDPTPSP